MIGFLMKARLWKLTSGDREHNLQIQEAEMEYENQLRGDNNQLTVIHVLYRQFYGGCGGCGVCVGGDLLQVCHTGFEKWTAVTKISFEC